MKVFRPAFRLAACLATVALVGNAAVAADWPTNPVKLVIGFPAGGPPDILARAVGQRLGASTGQPFVVENKPGAGGTIGGAAVAKAPADGQTLLLASGTLSSANAMYAKLPFDSYKDLVPIAALGGTPLVLIVNPNLPVKSVSDLAALARSSPGKLTVASPGVGTTPHLAAEMFQRQAKLSLTHVPYRGSGQALTDIMGGQVDAMFENLITAAPHIRTGKLRALAITSGSRNSELPEVPTMAEQGVSDVDFNVWFVILGPSSMPSDLVQTINRKVNAEVASKELGQQLVKQGLAPMSGTPEQVREMWTNEHQRLNQLVKDRGIRLE